MRFKCLGGRARSFGALGGILGGVRLVGVGGMFEGVMVGEVACGCVGLCGYWLGCWLCVWGSGYLEWEFRHGLWIFGRFEE